MNKAELIKALAELLAEKMEIGEEPTNGEVIQALFPNGKVIECDEAIGYEQMLDDKYSYCSWFDGLWWDAPYQKGGE